MGDHPVTLAVFALTLLATFAAAWLGRRQAGAAAHDGLSDEKLNRWLIGLSAGAAANSGFVVTGAVGLGYTGGLHFLLLPLGWLIGDVVFWRVFPARINAAGARTRATTLSELLTVGLGGRSAVALSVLTAILVTVCLSGYIAAQWVAGQKFLGGAFGVPKLAALGLFAVLIVSYTAIGGFRGSVYVDSLQAVIRLIGTTLAIVAVILAFEQDPQAAARIAAVGPGFMSLWDGLGVGGAAGILLGFAAASLGFGLGQPQLVSRYLAGASPEETQSAWWIYIGFVQFTWLAMTLFGAILRGVMPGLPDPEAGLPVFFETKMNPTLTGLIIADVFATIAATSNALLIAAGQSIAHDLGPRLTGAQSPWRLTPVCVVIGAATMGVSLLTNASVQALALGSVSLIGAGLAPAVMARVLNWPRTGPSLVIAVLGGVAVAVAWRVLGFNAVLNEAAPGIASGLGLNALIVRIGGRAPNPRGTDRLPRSDQGHGVEPGV